MDYLQKFKEKCKVNDIFMDKVNFLFERLLHFGYIDRLSVSKLEKKLYMNVDTVYVSSEETKDYKTGYYDAITKELYIKDIDDTESMFLRLVYAITTTKKKEKVESLEALGDD